MSPGPRAEADAVQDVDNGFVVIRDGEAAATDGVLSFGPKESRDRNTGGERCFERA